MNRIAVILFLFVAFSPELAKSQTTETNSEAGRTMEFQHDLYGVGIYASLCDGMGLSFKHHLAEIPVAYQVTAGVIKSGNLVVWDLGLEGQYDLSVGQNRVYALLGMGTYHYDASVDNPLGPTRFGLGLGYELQASHAIGLSLNLMVTVFVPSGTILPLPSVGVHYYFR